MDTGRREEDRARGTTSVHGGDDAKRRHTETRQLKETRDGSENESTTWTTFERNQRMEEDTNDEGRSFEADDTAYLITKLSVERNELQQQLEQLKREMHDVCDELGREIHASKELVQHTNTLKESVHTLLGESSDTQDDQGEKHSRADYPPSKEHSERLDLVDVLAHLTSKLEGDPPLDNAPQLDDALEKVKRAVGKKQEEETSTVPLDRPRSEGGTQKQLTLEERELKDEANKANHNRPVAPSPLSNRAPAVMVSYSGADHILFSRALLWTLAAAIAALLFFAPRKQSELLPVS